MSRRQPSRRRSVIMLAVAAALLAVAVMAGFLVTRGPAGTAASTSTSASASAPPAASGAEDSGTDGPPAAVTTSAVETDAAAPAANPSSGQTVATDAPPAVDGSRVTVELTAWGWNRGQKVAQVRGYAAGVVEEGGTCTLTLSRSGEQVSVEIEALPDASTTACGSVAVPGNRLSRGAWQAVLSYDSATSSGSSAPVQIEVPE